MPKRDLWLYFCCLAELNTLQNQYFSTMFRRSHIVPVFAVSSHILLVFDANKSCC